MSDVPNIANPAPGHLEQAERFLDSLDFRMTRRCWRIDVHAAHEWQARPDEVEGGPRQTVTCPGHVVTEGGWTRCPGCGTSGTPHPVGGVECRETAREKAISQGDE